MGAPESGIQAGDRPTADALLTAFRTIKDDERAKHVTVLDYWLSIRGDKEFPPLHDLDPLEISDAAEFSILFELLSGGQDAEIRHLGEALKDDVTVQRIIDAPSPSLLSSIARKLPIVGISRDFLAFEDNFSNADGLTRCWITLLPLSSCGSWVDYVYAFVSLDKASAKGAKPAAVTPEPPAAEETITEEPEAVAEEIEPVAEELKPVAEVPAEEPEVAEEVPAEPDIVAEVPAEPDIVAELPAEEPEIVEEATIEAEEPVAAAVESAQPGADDQSPVEAGTEPRDELEPLPSFLTREQSPEEKGGPGFSKILEGLAQLTGFYGQGVAVTDAVVEVDVPQSQPGTDEPEATNAEVVESGEPPLEVEETASAPEPELEAAETGPTEPATEHSPLELEVPAPALEGTLQSKLAEVQAKADEAREAQMRATEALHEGLSAAYDFALEAETCPEEYLRLVEAQGLKIQLRAPMAPVAKLAFDGVCDAATIRQFEAVLAWALKVERPRGELLERIKQAGGIPELLREFSKAA
jgi:hypothetical protein